MRVEIDLPNPDGLLRSGMYGRAKITLEPPSKNLTIPAACLSYTAGKATGTLFVVKDGNAHKLEVKLGADNGSLVEVLSGLSANDDVVLNTSAPLEEGLQVDAAESAKSTTQH